MKQYDLHGKTLKEAEEIFYSILNEVRLKGTSEEILFITGIGPIQRLLESLARQHELYHYIQMANRGCIVIEFE